MAARLLTVTGLLLLAAVAVRCGRVPSPESSPHEWSLATVSEADVTVTLKAEVDAAGGSWLAATYAPTRRGFHLYAKELPREGLAGIGRPTLLELGDGGPFGVRGPVTADRAAVPLYVPVLQMSFPVYPEGPVTLRLPVDVTGGRAERATVSVSYLACSASTCLAPVSRKPIVVTMPQAFVARRRAGE